MTSSSSPFGTMQQSGPRVTWSYDLRHGLLEDLEIDPADEPTWGVYDLEGL